MKNCKLTPLTFASSASSLLLKEQNPQFLFLDLSSSVLGHMTFKYANRDRELDTDKITETEKQTKIDTQSNTKRIGKERRKRVKRKRVKNIEVRRRR